MTQAIDSIFDVASDYDAIVLDQWGVLHDGSAAYPRAIGTVKKLRTAGHRLAVLSNSGKRSAPNAERIAKLGFEQNLFDAVMTSGEALWCDVERQLISERRFFAIERTPGDAEQWVQGLKIDFSSNLEDADAILLMGIPDNSSLEDWRELIEQALASDLIIYCSNPDLASPRSGSHTTMSPGALAREFRRLGGKVVLYGKPYRAIFRALQNLLGANRLLMVGDSLDHDVAGAKISGWDSLLIEDGLYSTDFAAGDASFVLQHLCAKSGAPAPTYRTKALK